MINLSLIKLIGLIKIIGLRKIVSRKKGFIKLDLMVGRGHV